MKILLINPPTNNMLSTNLPDFVEEQRGCYPQLGLLYLAAYIKKHSRHIVQIFDAEVEGGYAGLHKTLNHFQPDAVGLHTLSFNLLDVVNCIQIIKRHNESIRVLLGGPHVNIYPYESARLQGVDYVVLGEGEAPLLDLLNAIQESHEPDDIPGFVFNRCGEIVHTGNRPLIEDLDSLPFPARELTDFTQYFSPVSAFKPITTMFTSRGCPYQCIFCDRPHLGKSFRCRSSESVVDEMESISRLGIREAFILDDTFTVNRQRVVDICTEIRRRRLNIIWDVRARVNTVDYDLLKLMKSTGCERIHLGVESGSDRILENLRKGITKDQVRHAFQACRKISITSFAYFIIGCPGETEKEIKETTDFMQEIRPDYIHLSVMTPFPGTELYRIGLEKGIIPQDSWKAFAEKPEPGFTPGVWEEHFSRPELIDMLRKMYKRFYFRPRFIFKGLLRIKSLNDFLSLTRSGMKLLTG